VEARVSVEDRLADLDRRIAALERDRVLKVGKRVHWNANGAWVGATIIDIGPTWVTALLDSGSEHEFGMRSTQTPADYEGSVWRWT
jgi:hypothetical protein